MLPLSLACKNPEMVPVSSVCTLLVAEDQIPLPTPPSSQQSRLNPDAQSYQPPVPGPPQNSESVSLKHIVPLTGDLQNDGALREVFPLRFFE